MSLFKLALVAKDVKIFSDDPKNKLTISILAEDFHAAYAKAFIIVHDEYKDLKIFSLRESITDVR